MKKSSSLQRLLLIGTLGIVLLCVLIAVPVLRPCQGPSCLSFPNQIRFRTLETYEQSGKVWRGMLAAGPDDSIRLEVVSATKEEAEEFTAIRMTAIRGLFDTSLSPYPGAVSHTIRCDDRYKVFPEQLVSQSGVSMQYFSGYLNSRYQYGICVDDQIAFRVNAAMFYCSSDRQWIFLERIRPVKKSETDNASRDFFQKLRCRTL